MDASLGDVGPRLRAIRESRGLTLRQVADATGISVSTLSRLELGARRPQLELLLPLARLHRLPLDDLVGSPSHGDPRIHPRPRLRNGVVTLPLSGSAGPWEAFKQIHAPAPDRPIPQFVHPGWDWIHVIAGTMRLELAGERFDLEAGETAEFDTLTPHGFINPGPAALEVLCLFNADGARIHVAASDRPDDVG